MEYHEGSITLDTDKMVENELLKYKMYGFPKCCTTAMINNQGINLVLDKKINKTNNLINYSYLKFELFAPPQYHYQK